MTFHLLACISSHGYGHFAMTAPILNALNQQPSLKLTIRCELPEALIKSRVSGDFDIISESSDFGIVMNSSLDVDLEKSLDAYQDLHADFPSAIEQEKKRLTALSPDLVLANIPYVTIIAAKQAGLPVIAYCSLNWADIFKPYYDEDSKVVEKIYKEMIESYNSADAFVRPQPAMAMPKLSNLKNIGPIASLGNKCRDQILTQFELPKESKLVLVTPGGVATPVPVNEWPEIPGVIWIVAWDYATERSDIISTTQINNLFNDVLASCDAVITKPGYGTVTETVCNGIPALYVLRGDWPEESFLVEWWCQHGNVLEISREDFFAGNVQLALKTLWQRPVFDPVVATGTQELLSIVQAYQSNETTL